MSATPVSLPCVAAAVVCGADGHAGEEGAVRGAASGVGVQRPVSGHGQCWRPGRRGRVPADQAVPCGRCGTASCCSRVTRSPLRSAVGVQLCGAFPPFFVVGCVRSVACCGVADPPFAVKISKCRAFAPAIPTRHMCTHVPAIPRMCLFLPTTAKYQDPIARTSRPRSCSSRQPRVHSTPAVRENGR